MFARIELVLTLLLTIQFSVQQQNVVQEAKSAESLQNCFPGTENLISSLLDTENALKLYKSQQEFSIALIKDVHAKNTGQNIFFSPYSIHQALLLALFVSTNHTEHSIKQALFFPSSVSKAKIIQAFKMENEIQRLRFLNKSASYEFNTANSLFVKKDLAVRDCMGQLFKDEIYPVDYTDTNVAAQLINRWVSDKTKNQINNFLSPSDITQDISLILANAAYFKGLWQSKFLPENTRKEVFYITPSKNALVRMMRQKGTFKYFASERLGAHVLQIPYKGNDISMFILLPPFVSPNGMEYMLSKLNGAVLAELVEPGYMVERPVDISVPKFEVEQELKLVPILDSLGVGDLFRETADLSALTGKKDIYFNDAKHKAKISIDEDGTVAAASTAIFGFRSSRPLDPVKFICNHPFLYFIYDNISETILFIGIYNSPV